LFQETEDCDLRFTVSTFKFGLPWDANGIYNDLTRRPPKTFDDLLARVDEFSRVEDDDQDSNRVNFKMEGAGEKRDDDNGKKNKKDSQDYNKSRVDALRGVNTIFIKPIHKIMFEIMHKPFFKWPKQIGGIRVRGTPIFAVLTIKTMGKEHKIAKLLSNSRSQRLGDFGGRSTFAFIFFGDKSSHTPFTDYID